MYGWRNGCTDKPMETGMKGLDIVTYDNKCYVSPSTLLSVTNQMVLIFSLYSSSLYYLMY
jgi:hypothetical protein